MTHAPITITADSTHSSDYLSWLADLLPEGVVVRFRSDFFTAEETYCPFCSSELTAWVRSTIPGVWDRCECHDCRRQWDIEASVVEEMGTCEGCQSGPAMREPAGKIASRAHRADRGDQLFWAGCEWRVCGCHECDSWAASEWAVELAGDAAMEATYQSMRGAL